MTTHPGESARSEPARAAKSRLRPAARDRLGSIPPASLATASARIAESVLRLPEIASATGVLVCLSFGSELDTWGLTGRLVESGRRVYVPRAEPRDRQLHVHPYPCALTTLSFGLQQPPRGTPALADPEIDLRLDAALVVGLAFDRRGYRLGHGSGYFDRFLARHPVFSIGLTCADLLLDALPVEPHDRPMSVLVTELEVVRAGPSVLHPPLPPP
jgi:5-formyltetrahydrofolate cyclo-ligase